MATKAFLTKCITVLSAAFPANKLDIANIPAMLEIYGIVLEDVDDQTLGQAVTKLCAECKFFPAASELRSAALEIAQGGPAARKTALEEWAEVGRLVALHGRDGWEKARAELSPIAARAMQALGWWDFCMSDIEDAPSWRARFIECYNQVAARENDLALQPPTVTRYIESKQAQIAERQAQIAKRLSAPFGARQ